MLAKLRSAIASMILNRLDRFLALLTEYRANLSRMDLGAVSERPGVRDETSRKVRLLIRMRYAVDVMVPAVILLLAAEGLRLTVPERHFAGTAEYLKSLWPNWILIGVAFVTNVLYHYLLRRRADVRPIAHAQVWLDIVIFSLIIYMTGGISSPFAFLLTLPVLAASLLLSFRASLAGAAFSTCVMGVLAWLQYRHIIPSERYFEPLAPLTEIGSYAIAMVTLDGVLYFLIAFASGALASTIHKHEKALAHRADEATMLYEVSATLQSNVHLDDVLQRIMETLVRRLKIDHALMYLMNAAGDGLDLKVECFHPRIPDPPYGRMSVNFPLKRDAGLTAVCAIEKRAFNVTDPMNHPLINRDLARKLGLNPFAVAPMLARGKVIGVIGIDRRFQKGIISQEEAQTLAVAASQAGLAIQNASLYERFAA